MESMGKIADYLARNRARLGVFLSSIYALVSTVDPALIATYPRVSGYVAGVIGLILGAGAFKSDGYQRDVQGKL
jgi:hypothetical protein